MEESIMPEFQGQICRLVNPLPDENPEEVYIVTEDPSPFGEYDDIYVARLSELQRNISQPELTPTIAIPRNELSVIGNSLEDYVHSWNVRR